jgi:hypothetical protein
MICKWGATSFSTSLDSFFSCFYDLLFFFKIKKALDSLDKHFKKK